MAWYQILFLISFMFYTGIRIILRQPHLLFTDVLAGVGFVAFFGAFALEFCRKRIRK